MASVTEKRPNGTGIDTAPPMVHYIDADPYTAICGARLQGIRAHATVPVECVVCAELDRIDREMA